MTAPAITACRWISLLDVGCNSGDLSFALWKRFNTAHSLGASLIGVDVDSKLIGRANELVRRNGVVDALKFLVIDVSTDAACEKLLAATGSRLFDITCCFGLTMWIHLHHGDEGLQKFLTNIANVTHGTLLIEIHPWKCYQQAVKRLRKRKFAPPQYWGSISFRGSGAPEKFVKSLLHQTGFIERKHLGVTAWNREIIAFARAGGSSALSCEKGTKRPARSLDDGGGSVRRAKLKK